VFRLAQLITADTRQIITAEIADDMRKFLFEIENEDIDLKSIGIRNANKAGIIEVLYYCYGLKKKFKNSGTDIRIISSWVYEVAFDGWL